MQEWIVCLEECLPEFGVNLDAQKIQKLAEILKENAQCIQGIGFEKYGGRSSKTEPDYKSLYEKLKKENERLQYENDIYRGSVAKRRKVDVTNVRIENDSVIYYP